MRTALVLAIIMAAMIIVAGCTKANATVAPMNAPLNADVKPTLTYDGKSCYAVYNVSYKVSCTPAQEVYARNDYYS